MTSPFLVLAVAVVRAWTRVYTWRLDPLLRERRYAEIESDLWAFQQDPAGNRGLTPAIQVLARLAIGVPDDLGWRADHIVVDVTPQRRVAAVAATAAAFVGCGVLGLRLDPAGGVAEASCHANTAYGIWLR